MLAGWAQHIRRCTAIIIISTSPTTDHPGTFVDSATIPLQEITTNNALILISGACYEYFEDRKSWPLTLLLCAAAPVSAIADSDSTFQTSEVHVFDTDIAVAGAGTLLREHDSIELRVAMSGLDKKSTYSVWWIIFNNPAACHDGGPGRFCGSGDLGDDNVDTGVRNAAGFVTGTDGTANFTADLDEGEAPQNQAVFGQLNDSEGAEIHIVILSHGKTLVGSVGNQMSLPGMHPDTNCNPSCQDQFGIVFNPVVDDH